MMLGCHLTSEIRPKHLKLFAKTMSLKFTGHCDLLKKMPQNLFSARKKASQKVAHPSINGSYSPGIMLLLEHWNGLKKSLI